VAAILLLRHILTDSFQDCKGFPMPGGLIRENHG